MWHAEHVCESCLFPSNRVLFVYEYRRNSAGNFVFPNPKTTEPGGRRVQRTLEMVPGLLSWGTLIGMFVISFFLPMWAAILIILFDLYWLYRIVFISFYSTRAHFRLVEGKKTNWWERCQHTLDPEAFVRELEIRIEKLNEARKELLISLSESASR